MDEQIKLHCKKLTPLNSSVMLREASCMEPKLTASGMCMQDLLQKHDATLKKVFAWYACLPHATGQPTWEHFKHQSKGMIAGHLILLLTDFKVRKFACFHNALKHLSRKTLSMWCPFGRRVCLQQSLASV